jgi:hypothetical protein
MEQSVEEIAWDLVTGFYAAPGFPVTGRQIVDGGAPPRNIDIAEAAWRVSDRMDPEREPELYEAVEDIRVRYAAADPGPPEQEGVLVVEMAGAGRMGSE